MYETYELYSLMQQRRYFNEIGSYQPDTSLRQRETRTIRVAGAVGSSSVDRTEEYPTPSIVYPAFEGVGDLANIVGPGPTIINAQSDDEKQQPKPYAEAITKKGKRVTGTAALDILENGPVSHIS